MATFTPQVLRDRRLHNGYTVVARPETFGERLRRLRNDEGWRIIDLARRADVGRATISECENTRRVTSADTVARLAAAFGVSMDYLWRGTEGGT